MIYLFQPNVCFNMTLLFSTYNPVCGIVLKFIRRFNLCTVWDWSCWLFKERVRAHSEVSSCNCYLGHQVVRTQTSTKMAAEFLNFGFYFSCFFYNHSFISFFIRRCVNGKSWKLHFWSCTKIETIRTLNAHILCRIPEGRFNILFPIKGDDAKFLYSVIRFVVL